MLSFKDSLERLKHELRVSKDSEVAAQLGMSKTAFSDRKKRESFPEREVLRLSADKPELDLDVTFILTGERATAISRKQFASLAKAVVQMEPEGGQLSQSMTTVFRKQGALRKRPEYLALLDVLDLCDEDELELLHAIAVKLARE